MTDAIHRALEAASAATDAAEECATLSDDTRKALSSALQSQKRLVSFAGGAVVAAMICGIIGGVVYLRSVADLRQAAEITAAANKASVEQIQSMTAKLEEAQAALASFAQLEAQVSARIDGLGDRLSGDIDRIATESSALQPQFATAIKTHVDEAMKQTRGEILMALAELEAGTASGTGLTDPELTALLKDVRDKLNAKPAPERTATKKSTPPATPKPKPKPPVASGGATTSFSYP